MLFNLEFANNISIYLTIYFIVVAVIQQIFDTIAELATFIGIPNKEAKAEIKMHPVAKIIKLKQEKARYNLR